MTMSSVAFRLLGVLVLVTLFWVALGLWHRAPPPSPAALWLSGPEATVLMQTLGKNFKKNPALGDDPVAKDFFFPPVRGEKDGFWDGLGILYPVEPLQPIYAPADGQVLFNRSVADVGYVFMIRHNDQHISVITGIAQPSFQEGDTIKANQMLGIPETNTKTVFYMLRHQGKAVDPRKMFDTVDSPL
jgi:murein DD-endopeptidase MepM/ murein hydrolase activator NlpD